MSASHNPGGPKEDWGIKFNYSSGEPAPERITDAIYKYTQSIKELKTADLPDIDLAKIGNNTFGSFEVSTWSSSRFFVRNLCHVHSSKTSCHLNLLCMVSAPGCLHADLVPMKHLQMYPA